MDRLLKMILLESTVIDFFHDTCISFRIVIVEAFICSNLVMNHVSALSFSLPPSNYHTFSCRFHIFLLHMVTI